MHGWGRQEHRQRLRQDMRPLLTSPLDGNNPLDDNRFFERPCAVGVEKLVAQMARWGLSASAGGHATTEIRESPKAGRAVPGLADDAEVADDLDGDLAELVVLVVGQRLRRRDDHRLARVDAHRIEVLHIADDEAVVLNGGARATKTTRTMSTTRTTMTKRATRRTSKTDEEDDEDDAGDEDDSENHRDDGEDDHEDDDKNDKNDKGDEDNEDYEHQGDHDEDEEERDDSKIGTQSQPMASL